MPRIAFDLTSAVPPDRFISALTDFSPARADVWPNVDAEHFKVHEVGADWADVTEGSSFAGGVWERNRYDWSAPGTVRIETTESNTWRPGSFWLYEVEPAGAGSHITVTADRRPANLRGRVVAGLLVVAGRRALRGATEKVLRTLA
jgi:hypothetical protein